VLYVIAFVPITFVVVFAVLMAVIADAHGRPITAAHGGHVTVVTTLVILGVYAAIAALHIVMQRRRIRREAEAARQRNLRLTEIRPPK
jgi:uncharacterized membrane protein